MPVVPPRPVVLIDDNPTEAVAPAPLIDAPAAVPLIALISSSASLIVTGAPVAVAAWVMVPKDAVTGPDALIDVARTAAFAAEASRLRLDPAPVKAPATIAPSAETIAPVVNDV